MGGRGASSGSIGNMTRSQLANSITDLKTENRQLFKSFFKDDSKTAERTKYAQNTAKIEKMESRIREMDSAEGVNQRASAKDMTPKTTGNTTTYERARSTRISNFNAWFNGGKK